MYVFYQLAILMLKLICHFYGSKILLLLRDALSKTVPNPNIVHPTAQYPHRTALLFTRIISNQFLDLPVNKLIHVFDVNR